MTLTNPTAVTPRQSASTDLTGLGSNLLPNNGSISPNWSTSSATGTAPTSAIPAIKITPNDFSGSPELGGTTGPTVATPTQLPPTKQEVTSPSSSINSSNGFSGSPELGGSGGTPVKAVPVDSTTQSTASQLAQNVQPNPLNDFYLPTYHFRLFAAPDQDMIDQIKQLNGSSSSTSGAGSVLSAVAGKRTTQVTIAESGVTGINISDVTIETVGPGNSSTRYMAAQAITITVVEPMGISFLDGLLGASSVLKNKNVSKAPYYLELTFTGYKLDGTYAGRPMNALKSLPNGGVWLYSLIITEIETKLTEGSATYTIKCVAVGSEPFGTNTDDGNYLKVPNSMTVYGRTVKEMYQNFITQLNEQWKDAFGNPANTGMAPLVKFAGTTGDVSQAVQTYPIPFGPPYAIGKNPENFVIPSKAVDQSSSRTCDFANPTGKPSISVSPGTPVEEVLISILKNTEEAQILFKDCQVPSKIDESDTRTNDRGYKCSIVFAIEPDVKFIGYDTNHGQYQKQVTLHVRPHMTQGTHLSSVQVSNAMEPATQSAMIQNLVKTGFMKKRYDYIFTGKNTEVIDLEISWNMPWAAVLPRLDGTRMGYANEALHARLNQANTNPEGSRYQADNSADLAVKQANPAPTTVANQSTSQPGVTGAPALAKNPGGISFSSESAAQTSLVSLSAYSTPVSQAIQKNLASLPFNPSNPTELKQLLADNAARNSATTTTTPPSAPTLNPSKPVQQVNQNNGNNTGNKNSYIEDLVNAVDQDIPLSFWYGDFQTAQQAGPGTTSHADRGQSVAGAVFEQWSGFPLNNEGKFINIDLTIKGDPFWLGQTNVERQLAMRNGTNYDPTKLPDQISGHQAVQIYFRYPTQIGNDFKPNLKNSATFNGLYIVTNIVHEFKEGAFKQTLRCIKDPLIKATSLSSTSSSQSPGAAGSNPMLGQSSTPTTTSTTYVPSQVPRQ